jgi:hypothetical protein
MGRSGAAPAVAAIAPPSPALRARTLASGLRVVEWSGAEDVFSAALLVGAGPLDDPADLPGLTELALHAATLGTEADPDDTRPAARALALGGALHTVADGRVVGWVARGPRSAAPQLLELLRDLAAAPSLPASRFELLVAMAREQVETEGLGATGTGIAVAVGTALGLGRPVPLAPTAAMLERVHREDVLRHWRRIARPERAILVMRMPAGVAVAEEVDRVFGAWVADAPLPDEITPCLPLGQTLHRIATSDAAKTRSVALVATAAPGVGDPERGALEALAAWLSERPGGPIERLVGIDEATRARPWILDVGWGGGRGVAVVLSASGGDNADAASNLRGIAELFASQAEGPGLSGDDAVGRAPSRGGPSTRRAGGAADGPDRPGDAPALPRPGRRARARRHPGDGRALAGAPSPDPGGRRLRGPQHGPRRDGARGRLDRDGRAHLRARPGPMRAAGRAARPQPG